MSKQFTRNLLVIVLLVHAAVAGYAQTWDSPVQTTPGDKIGQYSKMLVVNGNPAMAAYDETRKALVYIRSNDANGNSWASKPVLLDASVDAGQYLSLCLVDGRPAISYYDATNGNLKYIRAKDATGSTWGSPLTLAAAGNVGQYTSLCMVNGRPAISYVDASYYDLKYVRANDATGSSWSAPVTLDANWVGASTSMCIVDGKPAISYCGLFQGLRYLRAYDAGGTTWASPVSIDATISSFAYTSLCVVDGNPAISYYGANGGGLKYVRAANPSGAGWGLPVTIASGYAGLFTSLCMVGTNPAISYYDGNNGDLRYVRAGNATGSSWGSPVSLDAAGDVGSFSSLCMVNGNPAVSYYDVTNGRLKYVRASAATGNSWGSPLAMASLGNIRLDDQSNCIVAGCPAICYFDKTSLELKFARANDAAGKIWSGPVTVVSGNIGLFNFCVVNGRPAISYYDPQKGYLMYVRANDGGGSSWSSPVKVDKAHLKIENVLELRDVSGRPAIVYYNSLTSPGLYYIRAKNEQGSSWNSFSEFNSGGFSFDFPDGSYAAKVDENYCASADFCVVNGNPAISFHDYTNDKLKFIRAGDETGSWYSWDDPVVVDHVTGDFLSISMCVVNGHNPAISYNDNEFGNLKYVISNSGTGSKWNVPMKFAFACANSSMCLVKGKPAVSYYDLNNYDLKYIRANDVLGNNWGTPKTLVAAGDVGITSNLFVSGNDIHIGYYAIGDDNVDLNGPNALRYTIHGSLSALREGAPDTATDVAEAATSIIDRSMRLAPNPATSTTVLQYEGVGAGPLEVRVLDLSGRVHSTYSQVADLSGNGSLSLDLSGLPAGMYLVAVRTADGQVSQLKLLHQ